MTTISIRIEEAEKEIIQNLAKQQDLSVSQIVRRAIKDYFVNNQITIK